jgi:DnaK suppressor protein
MTKGPKLDAAFIEKQRQGLTKLRASLLGTARNQEGDEGVLNSQTAGGAREYEDDAQKLAMLEVDGALVARDIQRAALVDRALKKIEEGTYGSSDLSGQLIPRERLEAVPESIYTLAEQEARERKA